MNRLIPCLALSLSLLPASASAQFEASIHIGLPVAPPLVVVQPGLQVVENHDEEVFFVGGWYWCRRGDHWYRGRSPRDSFLYVEPQRVPYRLAYLPPPGHYRHWRREQLRAERRWWNEHDGERRRAWKEHQNAEHRGWRAERGQGHGDYRPVANRGGPAPAPGFNRGGVAPAPGFNRGGPGRDHDPAVGRGGPAPAPPPGQSGHRHEGHRD